MHHDETMHLQAVRPINKSNLDSSSTVSTPPAAAAASTVYIDCHLDPTTQKNVVMWDDIRLAFAEALHIRHQAKVVPFLRGADLMLLQPLRIAAMPHVTLDIVVDEPLTRLEAALLRRTSLMTIQDTAKEVSVHEEASAHITTTTTIAETKTATVGRSSAHGLVEATVKKFIENPAFDPQPRTPKCFSNSDDDHSSVLSDSLTLIHEQPGGNGPSTDDTLPQAPQDQTAAGGDRDISHIVVKATLGDADARVELGNMHKVGDGVEQDYEAARYWYLKAARQGHASAQCGLGDLYRLGLGIDLNHWTALGWYLKAVGQGDATGQCNLGIMYQYGLAVEMDYAAAMYWYRKSANQGHAFAQNGIATLYLKGCGVPKDYSKAMEYHLLAAKQGLSWAHYNVGARYRRGKGVAKDEVIALKWFQKATVGRDTDSWVQFSKGYSYYKGLGTPQDYSNARRWLLKSACQGCSQAQFLFASSYLYGYGVPQDYSEAMMWFLRAADQHFPLAQLEIGHMYRQGLGVSTDNSIAKKWYTKAARQEIASAKKALEEF